jgi:hypothetical protein
LQAIVSTTTNDSAREQVQGLNGYAVHQKERITSTITSQLNCFMEKHKLQVSYTLRTWLVTLLMAPLIWQLVLFVPSSTHLSSDNVLDYYIFVFLLSFVLSLPGYSTYLLFFFLLSELRFTIRQKKIFLTLIALSSIIISQVVMFGRIGTDITIAYSVPVVVASWYFDLANDYSSSKTLSSQVLTKA